MALTSYLQGKTLTTTGSNIQIFGVPFNPYIASGTATGITNTVANNGTFDLTGFQFGHEVVGAYGTWDETGGHFIEFKKGGSSLFTAAYSGFTGVFAYIGIDYDEISANASDYTIDFGVFTSNSNEGFYDYVAGSNYINFGTYSPIFYAGISNGDVLSISFYDWDGGAGVIYRTSGDYTVSSKSSNNVYFTTNVEQSLNAYSLLCLAFKGKSVQNTLNYTITNFPTITGPHNSGYIWVEGENICFIDAVLTTTGYKHAIKHDGSSYSTGKTPGMMWVDQVNHGKIAYIDSSGVERKTHTGDINGSQGHNETSLSGKTPGMMWISDPAGNYAYLTFIGYDGNGYRIMNGTV